MTPGGRALEALVEPHEGGGLLVRSPAVGSFAAAVRVGDVLVGRGRVGRLTQLGRALDVVLPADAAGRLVERAQRHRQEPVEYGQLLVRLAPIDAESLGEGGADAGPVSREGLPEGALAIASPTHGVFYSRPGPDAPAYVEPGQVVESGATLGLIEVMKSFTAIPCAGDGVPPRVEVLEVRVADGAEVEADQVLFVVRPPAGASDD